MLRVDDYAADFRIVDYIPFGYRKLGSNAHFLILRFKWVRFVGFDKKIPRYCTSCTQPNCHAGLDPASSQRF